MQEGLRCKASPCSARPSCLVLLVIMDIQELETSAGGLQLQDNAADAAVEC